MEDCRLYISSDGEEIEVATMPNRYLLNALVAAERRVVMAGENANPRDRRNASTCYVEVRRRMALGYPTPPQN